MPSRQNSPEIASRLPPPPLPRTLRGSQGPWVEFLQRKLSGFGAGELDGIFDDDTEAAVRAFQRAFGLDDDGIVGRKTWAKLKAGVLGRLAL